MPHRGEVAELGPGSLTLNLEFLFVEATVGGPPAWILHLQVSLSVPDLVSVTVRGCPSRQAALEPSRDLSSVLCLGIIKTRFCFAKEQMLYF